MSDFAHKEIFLSDGNELLSEALVYLDKAISGLKKIQRPDIPELRTYSCPPAIANEVFKAIWFLEGHTDDFNWRTAMNELTIQKVQGLIQTSYKFRLSDDIKEIVYPILYEQMITHEKVNRISLGASHFFEWADNIIKYAEIMGNVEKSMSMSKN